MTDDKTKQPDSITDAEARQLAEKCLEKSLQDNRFLTERNLQLLQVQRKISGRLPLNEVLDTIIDSAVNLLNIDAAEVLLLDQDGERLTSRASALIEPNPTGTQIPITDRIIVEKAIRGQNQVILEDIRNESRGQLPVLLGGKPVRALISIPLKIEDKVIGALNVYSSEPRGFTEQDLQTLTLFSEGAAIAVSNARLYMDIDRERRRLQTVLDTAPSGLIVVEGPDARIAFMNRRSQEFFGTYPEIGKPLPAYLASSKLLHPDNSPFNPNELPIYRSSRSGEVVQGEELIIETQNGQRHYLLLRSAPLYDEDGGIYGAVASTEDITQLREGQEALRQAYIRESQVSQTLQQALLPTIPKKLEGLHLASVYRAALEEAQIGGDFFDVFSPAPGLIGIVIGDVAGKGVEAAVRTALIRHSLKAYAYIDPSPAGVMEAVNNVIMQEGIPESFITVFYGLLNMQENSLCYVNAGHEPPLCLAPDKKTIVELPNSGIPLGVKVRAAYVQHLAEFPEGSKILLYTDGVTEARSKEGFFGLERLKEFLISHSKESPAEFVDHLMDYIQNFASSHLRDDVAILLAEKKHN